MKLNITNHLLSFVFPRIFSNDELSELLNINKIYKFKFVILKQ